MNAHQKNLGKAQFPQKAMVLFKPAPFKVLYGGRSSSKTWSVCRALLILGSRRPLFILCAREIQKSIKDSVHKTLADQIEAMGLGWFYRVLETSIIGLNGTRFTFAGIRNNITAIKSMEGIDICAVFEATFVSRHSWEVLLPTIRKDPPGGPFAKGAEIIVEFNPELTSDETYQRWVVAPPKGTVVVEMNYHENPWFPETSRNQMEEMKTKDYESYLTIWEGKTRKTLAGAVYAKEIAAATVEGRINPHVKADRTKPVSISFDLGREDMTCIWFWQQVGMDHYAVDYIDGYGNDFSYYVKEVQAKGYMIGKVYLPHDAAHHHLSALKSIEMQARAVWPTDGQVIVNPSISNLTLGINLVRAMFPRIFINEVACAGGLMGLQHYHYGADEEKRDPFGRPQRTMQPVHDWASHSSDAFRTYAEGLRDPERDIEERPRGERARNRIEAGARWMQ